MIWCLRVFINFSILLLIVVGIFIDSGVFVIIGFGKVLIVIGLVIVCDVELINCLILLEILKEMILLLLFIKILVVLWGSFLV